MASPKARVRPPAARSEVPLAVLMGLGFALALFLAIALVQMLGEVEPPERGIDEKMIAFNPPDVEKIEEEPPPPEEEEPPELEEEPPQLSLDQLDIALNPGTGSLAGDFGMPDIAGSQHDLGTEEFVKFSSLDQVPRPVGVAALRFPRRLRTRAANGRIVLLIKLSPEGDVLDVEIESSTLPRFNDFVVSEVKDWKFTPPTQQGRPVRATARLPIPIRIN